MRLKEYILVSDSHNVFAQYFYQYILELDQWRNYLDLAQGIAMLMYVLI